MEHVLIGKIVNTRGLKGEVKVLNYSDFKKDRYQKGKIVDLFNEQKKEYVQHTISSFHEDDGFIYLTFVGLNKIEDVQIYKNYFLVKRIDDLKSLSDGNYYHYQLLNMDVIYHSNKIGFIEEIIPSDRQDLIRIKQSNDKSFLIPFIDEFVVNVNIDSKTIEVDNIEGFL